MRYLLCSVLLFSACAHATTTAKRDTTGQATATEDVAAKSPTNGERSGATQSRLERVPKKPGEALVTSSPAGLLEKGAAETIQRALAKHGVDVVATGVLDGQTSDALRLFQKSQKIAAHGMPDELTLARLGLDPAKLYRSNAKGDEDKNAKRNNERK